MQNKRGISWTLLTLFFLFLIPITAAWYFFHYHILFGTINEGQLIQPPSTIDTLALQNENATPFPTKNLLGSWVMMYVVPKNCDQYCMNNLYNMRQIRIALGKDQYRVRRLIVTTDQVKDVALNDLINNEYQGTLHGVVKSKLYKQFIRKNHIILIDANGAALFMVDPQGYILMSYKPTESAEHILKDIHRLISVSEMT